MENYDLIVIGAGPAGIMAAITAAQKGKHVLLLEKNETVGRKILATGNGRCNLTNRNIEPGRYHGASKAFVEKTLLRFDQNQTMNFFESHGVILKEEDRGRIFPRTNQASTIVEALKHLLKENQVAVKTSTEVKSIEKNTDFVVKTVNNETFMAKTLILTTGGKAAHQLGSSGDGLFWAKELGHSIVPVYAALVPLETEEAWTKEVQGLKMEAGVTTTIGDKILKKSAGDILFTHFGLSGPAIMTQAGEIAPQVGTEKVSISLDLYPEISEAELDQKLEAILKASSKKNIGNSLLGLLPASLVPVILKIVGLTKSKNASEISKADRRKIVECIKGLKLTVKKVRPLKEAQVSSGGIDAKEINSDTLESKIVKGLYFAGEIIDVDGDSGGFNLQWAWSSGFVAGQTD